MIDALGIVAVIEFIHRDDILGKIVIDEGEVSELSGYRFIIGQQVGRLDIDGLVTLVCHKVDFGFLQVTDRYIIAQAYQMQINGVLDDLLQTGNQSALYQ